MPRKHRHLYCNAILCVIFTFFALPLPAQHVARPSFASAPDSENISELPQHIVTADRTLPLASYLFGDPKVEPRQFYDGLMPVGEMLASTDRRKRSARWSQQCYAFVHMCLCGYRNKYQKPFVEYVARACAGPVAEKDFKKCTGRIYTQMTLDLRLYMEGCAHTYALYKEKGGGTLMPKPPPVELCDATQAEIGCVKEEVFRLGMHYEKSRNALIIPYISRERDAGLLAAHIDILIEGMRRAPRNAALVYITAELCAEGGDTERARALVNLALRIASAEAGRTRFEMLGRRLPAQPSAASDWRFFSHSIL